MRAAGPLLESALVIVPEEGRLPVGDRVRGLRATHPVPSEASVAAGEAALDAARTTPRGTLLVVLLSGGASALMAAPAPGLTLDDKRAMTAALLESGAPIGAINAVRRHCSRVKGGGLLRAASAAEQVWTLALSDVIGDDPATIGSGPTAPDSTTFEDVAAVLREWGRAVPPAIHAVIRAGVGGERPETLKREDPMVERAAYVVVGSNALAVSGAQSAASAAGYLVVPFGHVLAGEAEEEGVRVASRILDDPTTGRPVALVAGGEPTVRVVPGGVGGRAQHLALAAAPGIAGSRCLLLAAGTDGIDGPTDAAGAWVDGGTMAEAAALGIDVAGALARTDSHPALARLGSLVRTGPTGTNVADVVIALRAC